MDETPRPSWQGGIRVTGYGFVYALRNRWMPGLVKIGQTGRHPVDRAVRLSNHTGVPGLYSVAFYVEVTDRFAAEEAVHSALQVYRLSPEREFFRISEQDAAVKIDAALASFVSPMSGGIRLGPVSDDDPRLLQLTPKERAAVVKGTCAKCEGPVVGDALPFSVKCRKCGWILRMPM